MVKNSPTNIGSSIEEKPPVLSSWNKVYAVVIINLIVLIILFYLFTNYFS